MTWLIIDAATGAALRQAAEPVAAANEAAVLIPASSLMDPPLCAWSPEARGFVELPPPISCIDFVALWTPAETLAVMQTTSPEMAVAWAMTLASPQIHLDNPLVLAGIALAESLDILTPARAARIRAGLPPEI